MGVGWRKSSAAAGASAVVLAACSASSSASGQNALTTAIMVDAPKTEVFGGLDESAQLVREMRERVPMPVASHTQCVVAVPSTLKAGVVVGAGGANGYAACRTARGWSAPAPISLTGGALQTQIGVESADLLLLVTSDSGRAALSRGDMRIGVDASAAPGFVGSGLETSVDGAPGTEILSYSRLRGVFSETDLNGSTVKTDPRATGLLYGSPRAAGAILAGDVGPPRESPSVRRFLAALSTSFGP